MEYNDETRAQLKTEMAGVNITVSLTGDEILSLVAMAQLAYISNPALGKLGECDKSATQKIQGELDPNSLLAQHLKEGWVSQDFWNFKPVRYSFDFPPESNPESFSV
jgi:hypothetical protein